MITVITVVGSENARLTEMSKTLAANARQAGVEFEWIVVTAQEPAPDLSLQHVAIPASTVPTPSSARNAGLSAAKGDYVVFLEESHIPTAGWLQAVAATAELGCGFTGKVKPTGTNFPIPDDGLIRNYDRHGKFIKVKATTAACSNWGAPKAAFDKIKGFDVSYDGELGYANLDACVRLGRAGVAFVTSERAWVLKLRVPGASKKGGRRGNRNRQLYNELCLERNRTAPKSAAPPTVAIPPGVPTATAAPAAATESAPAPAEVAPPVPAAPDTGDDQGERQAAPPRLGFVGASKISGANKKA